jgi:hypothetical protein
MLGSKLQMKFRCAVPRGGALGGASDVARDRGVTKSSS